MHVANSQKKNKKLCCAALPGPGWFFANCCCLKQFAVEPLCLNLSVSKGFPSLNIKTYHRNLNLKLTGVSGRLGYVVFRQRCQVGSRVSLDKLDTFKYILLKNRLTHFYLGDPKQSSTGTLCEKISKNEKKNFRLSICAKFYSLFYRSKTKHRIEKVIL